MELVDMFSADRDLFLGVLKQRLASGEPVDMHGEYKELMDEWKESIRVLGERKVPRLSDKQRDTAVFKRVSEFTKYKLAYLDSYTLARESALSALGGVILYLDYELSAFRVAGNPSLRDELREKGIRHGTRFKRNDVGVFVANQARYAKGQTLCRVGEENFLEVFSDYVCFARYEEEEFRDFWGVNLIIAPKTSYSRVMKAQVSQILEMLDVSNKVMYPFQENKLELLQAAAYGSNDMLMLVDCGGYVAFTSEEFEKRFGRGAKKWPMINIRSLMPELEFIMQYIKDGTPRSTREILLTDASGCSRFYVIDFVMLKKHDRQLGMKCIFVPVSTQKRGSTRGYGQKTRYDFDSIKGRDPKLLEIKRIALSAAQNTSSVLVQGESGTGKELMAQAIHAASTNRSGAFVPINCAAITPDLLTSELFGYEDGAFTGAVKGGKAGKFEQADGGTIFLDEISEMPLNMQSSLLRVLEDGVISRVGGNRYISLNIRVIAATNKDLWSCVQAGTFRADLFFRLNIIKITLPPIRERRDDIELMMRHFVSVFAENGICRIKDFDREVIELFKNYAWPGNVRELRNVIERCANSFNGEVLTKDAMPPDLVAMMTENQAGRREETSFAQQISSEPERVNWKKYDKQRIAALMEKYNGNKSKIAKELGLSRGTLYKKLREFGLED